MWRFLGALRGHRASLFPPSLSSLLRKFPGILWTADRELRLTFLAGSGFPPSEMEGLSKLGQPVSHLFANSATIEDAVVAAHTRALGGEASTVEIEARGRCLEAQIEPLPGCNGEVDGVIGVALDTTERRVAERALRLSEQSYRSLIDDAPYAICRVTPGGQLLQTNKVMAEMLGYEAEQDLLLHDLPEVFSDSDSLRTFGDQVKQTGAVQGLECKWRRRDGQTVLVRLSARKVRNDQGHTSYVEIFGENVSDRRQLEDQLRQAQKMQAIGQLAGGIAHDFNNILTVISGQVELVVDETPKDDPRRRRLEETQKAAERAAALTRKLLAFSRKQVMQARVLDLNTVITGMNQMLARLIGENVEFVFNPGADLWNVKADPSQVEQVLMNLAVNSRDAMPHGGRLTIETRNARIPDTPSPLAAYVKPGEYVIINITDTGHGMDAATQAHLFEPFYTTKTAGKGTGLGLAMVYGIVKQSSGYIWVQSERGKGATFEIYLPRALEPLQQEAPALPKSIPKGTETILLVEDEEKVRQMLAEFLRGSGYQVFAAANGDKAKTLAEARRSRVDLLLTDMVMPVLGGLALAEDLKKKIPRLKVLFMSGYPGNSDPRNGAFPSSFSFVQKPFSLQALAQKVREILDSPAPASEEQGLKPS